MGRVPIVYEPMSPWGSRGAAGRGAEPRPSPNLVLGAVCHWRIRSVGLKGAVRPARRRRSSGSPIPGDGREQLSFTIDVIDAGAIAEVVTDSSGDRAHLFREPAWLRVHPAVR